VDTPAVLVDGVPSEKPAQQRERLVGDLASIVHVHPEVLVFLGAMADSERVGDTPLADDVQDTDLLGEPDRIPERGGTAASRMGSCLVRAAIADARMCGTGRCPSSVA
jgi:hypothetical protein